MRILVVSQYYYPEQFRINDICEELVRRGHRVTVVTGLPNYPEGKVFDGYQKSYKKIDTHNGVCIIRCKIVPRGNSTVSLLLNYISYAHSAAKRIKRIDDEFDVIYVYQMSPVTMIYPAIKYKKKHNAPIYVYCCDIWPESVREKADGSVISYSNPVYFVAKVLSRKLYSKVDLIGTKCSYFSDYLINTCRIREDMTKVLYEHAEDSYLAVPEIPEENDCYDFMFLGNIGSAQNCDVLVKAISKVVSTKPFKLHFVGSGSSIDNIKELVRDLNLDDKVVFHGRHPVSEINYFYSFADCCVLALSNQTAIGLTPPAKLVGYMAASRPVIAMADGATKDIVNDSDCGICVKTKDINALIGAMTYAINHSEQFKEKGINGRKYFLSHFTLKEHIDLLEKQLNELVGGNDV